ncbi:uncharacterized protein PAC_01017 [Phialocephala subalpina]|uniref:BTB domain-containing protein n=1 Tax=Phialocephala subalpina TaxID=576137 RepID=A0A1L7WEC8_9HELO|nr:uncharacterized protein PAC_01017 [Phialocephala subalpina]
MAPNIGSSDLTMKSPKSPPKIKKKAEKRRRFDNSTQMVILVAKDEDTETKFVVHEDFACQCCPKLRAAFNSEFIEAQTKPYKSSETTATIMEILVELIYTQLITVTQLENKDSDRAEAMGLVLADFLGIPRLQNDIVDYMNAIAAKLDRSPPSAIYKYVYKNTPEHSALRNAIVILVVAVMDDYVMRKDAEDYPKEMLVDMETMANMKKPADSYQNILESYPQAYVDENN